MTPIFNATIGIDIGTTSVKSVLLGENGTIFAESEIQIDVNRVDSFSVEQDPNDPSNFFVTDNKGQQFVLDNKSESNLGDYIDFARPAAQSVGATIGTVLATPSGPVGMAGGAGLGEMDGS